MAELLCVGPSQVFINVCNNSFFFINCYHGIDGRDDKAMLLKFFLCRIQRHLSNALASPAAFVCVIPGAFLEIIAHKVSLQWHAKIWCEKVL